MPTVATRQMKPDTRAVLEAVSRWQHTRPGQWFRPKDVGGTATNCYARHLQSLVTRGLVERREATQPGAWREKKLWEYRLTERGSMAAAA